MSDKKKINILLLSGVNPYTDSGIWAYDIYKSLTQKGHSVLLLTQNHDERFEAGIESISGKQKWKSGAESFRARCEWLYRLFIRKISYHSNKNKKRNPDFYMSILNEKKHHIPTEAILSHIRTKIDAIIYLFPHDFLDSKNLYELNRITNAPVFVMPVDMASFTGGCHYANNCENYKQHCGCCPGLYSSKATDSTYKNLTYKKQFIQKTNIHTLGNSWTINALEQSYLYNDKPNHYLDVVVDDSHYCPGNKQLAKEQFSIPNDKKIIFFGASFLENKRKGLAYLVDALNQLYDEISEEERNEIGIAIAGNSGSGIDKLFSFEVFLLGHLSHQQLPDAYRMADVFTSPSTQDAGPMMVIQSMMCGTPVVAFEMGNALDFIIDGKTGFKAPLYDTESLKKGIYSILTKTEPEKEEIAAQCREIAMKKSSYDSFEQIFTSVYEAAK